MIPQATNVGDDRVRVEGLVVFCFCKRGGFPIYSLIVIIISSRDPSGSERGATFRRFFFAEGRGLHSCSWITQHTERQEDGWTAGGQVWAGMGTCQPHIERAASYYYKTPAPHQSSEGSARSLEWPNESATRTRKRREFPRCNAMLRRAHQ